MANSNVHVRTDMCFKLQKNDDDNPEFSWKSQFYRPDDLQSENLFAATEDHQPIKCYSLNTVR